MRIGNCVLDERMMECYATLGIEPTGNLCEIQRAYRDSVRMVHPDRVAYRRDILGVRWSKEECEVAFNSIKAAYEYLRGQVMEIDIPDYDLVYNNDCDSSSAIGHNMSLEEFNRKFEEQHNKDTNGYQEYSNKPRTLEELIVERNMPIPKDIRPKEAMELVPWVGDMVASCGVGVTILGGEEPTRDLEQNVSNCDLDAAYGHPRDIVENMVDGRDYPKEDIVYSDIVGYSEVVAKEIVARELAAKKLDISRKERLRLNF